MRRILNFESCLKDEIKDFLELRKSQGHDAGREEYMLYTLDKHLKSTKWERKDLSPEIINGWLSSLPGEMSVNTKIVYISHYRQFARFLSTLGYTAFIPERPVEDKSYMPYIFSGEEILALIRAADTLVEESRPNGRHSAVCFSVIIRLLCGCGLRLNEALTLKTCDVDMETCTLKIRCAKGNKDRIVPYHKSIGDALAVYMKSAIPQKDGLLFPSKTGASYSQTAARYYFGKYLENAGISRKESRRYERNICIHCLRHSFAVHSFRQMHKSGKDMYDEAPVLSAYMGHDSIYGTERYLHMAAENSADIISMMEDFNRSQGLFPEVDG